MVSEDDYNLSIQSSELCVRANKGRATFFRQYRQVGDIFKLKDLELIEEFSTMKFSGLTQTMVWSRVLIFIAKNREVFDFKFRYDRDKVFRRMIVEIRDEIAPGLKRYDERLANKLFEMLYFEVRGIVKIWIRDGAKVDAVDRVVQRLVYAANNVNRNWGTIFAT